MEINIESLKKESPITSLCIFIEHTHNYESTYSKNYVSTTQGFVSVSPSGSWLEVLPPSTRHLLHVPCPHYPDLGTLLLLC